MSENTGAAPDAPAPTAPAVAAPAPVPAPPASASPPQAGSAPAQAGLARFLRGIRIREDLAWKTGTLLGGACLGALLAFWFLITIGEGPFISPAILPGPFEVVAAFPRLHFDHALVRSCLISLARVTAGFLIAAVAALPLGIAMGASTRCKAFFAPVSTIGGYVPIAALVPLTISWFGIDETQKIAFLAIASFVMLLPMVVRAIDKVDDVYLHTGYTLGADGWQAVRHVLVPVALADIYGSLRLLYGVGWGYIILAEVVGADKGLGYLIQLSQRRNMMAEMYAVLGVIVALSLGIDWALRKLGQRLFPYAKQEA